MKTVKIISGKYGHRPDKSKPVRVVRAGESVDVSDEQAERLVKLGVAVVAEAPVAEIVEDSTEETDVNDLYTMTNAQLRDLAAKMGVDVSKARTKATLIDTILLADTLPEMDAEEPVT